MTEGPLPVSIRTRFERFPATVKGAFIVRGEDADPHQVSFLEGRVIRLPSGPGRPVPLEPVVLDVPPHRDLYLPFELGVADLEPGWYGLESLVEVDGSERTVRGDRRFVVPWPRSAVRRGTVRVDRRVRLEGGPGVEVVRLECEGTTCTVHYTADPAEAVEAIDVRVRADGERVDRLDRELDPEGGRGKVVLYPIPSGTRSLHLELSTTRRRGAPATVEVDLR